MVLLDISATHERSARRSPKPCAGPRDNCSFLSPSVEAFGSLDDATAVFDAGADKISINSAALADPTLITCIAQRYGSQAVIVAIDAKRTNGETKFEAYVSGGRKPTGRDAIAWAREAEDRGAGEILLTSMDRDGTGAGFDCDLTCEVSEALHIPVIASGGGGRHAELHRRVSSAAEQTPRSLPPFFTLAVRRLADLKQELQSAGIPVRWPC